MTNTELEFKNGEAVLLYHDDDSDRRYWNNGVEEFSRARIHPTHVEFRQLTSDGVDLLESGNVIAGEYQRAPIRALAQVAFSRAVLFEGAEKWEWYADAVPLTDTMNSFSRTVLQPRGAHSMPLRLQHGDGPDDKFTVHVITHSIADGYFPVSTTARYFLHDMEDHSFGVAALDKTTADVLREMSAYAIDNETTDKDEARQLKIIISKALDYYTYLEFFIGKTIPGDANLLLSTIISRTVNLRPRHDNNLRCIVREFDLEVAVDGTVNRPTEVTDYYQRIKALAEQTYKFPL